MNAQPQSEIQFDNSFANDVLEGLSATPKHLPSKYFYDAEGSRLFQQIMELPEYYLTNAETDIFQAHADSILNAFKSCGTPFHLIELGAGDASKTRILIQHFLEQHTKFDYNPVDISRSAVEQLASAMHQRFKSLHIKPIVGDYMESLDRLASWDQNPRIVLFLGSTIGNFTDDEAIEFCREIRKHLTTRDRLFIGFDLKKDPCVIKRAYDDSKGVTAAFNFNLLKRINRELQADFELDQFEHQPAYNPDSGLAESYLVSSQNQTVFVEALDQSFEFKDGEPIHTEVSIKYDQDKIRHIATQSGFAVIDQWSDTQQFFTDSLWQPTASS